MEFLETFKSPGVEYRALPFWAWNGKLDQTELMRQLEIIRQMGFGGFFMHSRTGLATEYLGDEWFALTNACADRGKELGLSAWLYDEDRWPSGSAGGAVSQNPAFRMRFLRMERVSEPHFDQCLAVFAVTEKDGCLTDWRRLFPGAPAEPAGTGLLEFRVVEMPCGSFYNGYTYIDTMNREATEAFLRRTHEQYVKHCGDRIGREIRGIFTDEPHRGPLMTSFGQGSESGETQIPFTPKLPELFRAKYGTDLLDQLPELFLRRDDSPSLVKWQYVELAQELFLDNFAKPIDEWCRKHSLILTGHILHENNLTSQTAMSGSVMRYYEYMESPGIDFLGEHDRCFWIAKQLQSVARQLGKKKLLSELDGCTGWQMRFEDYKAVGDWQALYGINVRCPHLSWYTMQGQAKRDYPASIFHQPAWWKDYAYVEDYYARIAVFTEPGTPCCRVLVLNPVESVWAQVYPGWCDGLSPKGKRIRELELRYEQIFRWLQGNHIDFDYGDEDILARHGRTERASLRVGLASYDAVVVSGMDTIRSSTVSLLKAFSKAGGKLIVCGEAPSHTGCVPGVPDWDALTTKAEEDALVAALSEFALDIREKDGGAAKDILCQRKQDGGTTYLMLNNSDRENGRDIEIRLPAEGTALQFLPETGEALPVPCRREGTLLCVPLRMEAVGSCLLAIGNNPWKAPALPAAPSGRQPLPLNGPFSYELAEDNLCVLDYAAFSVNGAPYSPPMEILKADRSVREQLGLPRRGGEMLQPWFVRQKELKSRGNVSLRFDFDVEAIPTEDTRLILEEPERFAIFFNGVPLGEEIPDFYWADICYHAFAVPASLYRLGTNTVELRTDYTEASNLEALFLGGSFGVTLDGNRRVLTKLPSALTLGDIVPQGLPFYSGELAYRITGLPDLAGRRAWLRLDHLDAACVRMEGNGRKALIAWRPYEAEITGMTGGELRLTAVLTRRNTFGPLHQLPARAGSYGPESFETEGKAFTDDYVLLPAGLAAPVELLTEAPSAR